MGDEAERFRLRANECREIAAATADEGWRARFSALPRTLRKRPRGWTLRSSDQDKVCFRPIADITRLVQFARMILVALLLAGASPAPHDAVRLQATRCGFKADQIVWRVDTDGHERADILPTNWDGFFKSMACLINWAEKSGVRVGFVSDPQAANKQKR